MTRHIFALAYLALIVGCSGYDLEDQGDEIGQIEQAFRGSSSPDFQYGVRTGTSHERCNKTSASQVCSVPLHKNLEVAYTVCLSGCSPLPATQFSIQDSQLIGDMSNGLNDTLWNITTQFDVTQSPPPNTVRLLLQNAAVSGTQSTVIDGYSGITLVSPSNLNEGGAPGANTPVGQYQSHGACIGKIDQADIIAKAGNPVTAAYQRLFKQSFVHIALTCMGLGSNPIATLSMGARTAITTFDMPILTPGEVCMLNSYDATNNGDFSTLQASPCPSN